LRRLRLRLAAEAPDAAERAAALLPRDKLPPLACVAGYHPAGSEMDPAALCRRLATLGATLALPVAGHRDGPLVFRTWSEGDLLIADAAGVPAPAASAAAVRPDMVITPLLAFDRAGGRLGQGGGHYDRTLAELRGSGPVFVLGLAYAGQELPEIPMEAHDQRLDAILTEIGYIEVGQG
jgi:5-formyltetrahydrofolate cyclo-ligase